MSLYPEEIYLCFSDLKMLFKKLKKKLQKIAILSSLSMLLFILLKSPLYEADATFRQASIKKEFYSAWKKLLQTDPFGDSEQIAISSMRSRTLLRSVIEEMGLQAKIDLEKPMSLLVSSALKNLKNMLDLPLQHPSECMFKNVIFEEAQPIHFFIRSINSTQFEILDKKKNLIAQGKLGESLSLPHLTFTVEKFSEKIRPTKIYPLTFYPWQKILKNIMKRFSIKKNKIDASLLSLHFVSENSWIPAEFLNRVMRCFQRLIRKDHEEIYQEQRAYLAQRQDELLQNLAQSLDQHVSYLKVNLGDGGFIDLHNEMELLEAPRQNYLKRLFEIELTLKRLNLAYPKALERTIENKSDDAAELDQICEEKKAAELVLKSRIEEKEDENANSTLLGLKHRIAILDTKKRIFLENQNLKNLTFSKFDGINLSMAEKLYEDYNKEIVSIQTSLRQLLFVREELFKPYFELSSLCAIFSDPISSELTQNASRIAIKLQETGTRSLKEQERLKETLETEKKFIAEHLEKTAEWHKLRLKLLEDKVLSLHGVWIDLLKNEKAMIEEKLFEWRQKLSSLPDKWRFEKELKLKTGLCKGIVEGMSQLVESKNVNHHLLQVESRPLDIAIIPSRAQPSYLFLSLILAAFIGPAAFYFYHLLKSIFFGLPVSIDQLKLRGLKNFISLSQDCDLSLQELTQHDLNSLRYLSQFLIKEKKEEGLCVATILGKNPNYLPSLLQLLAKMELKSLIIDCTFNGIVLKEEVPGLFHYLNKEVAFYSIRQKEFHHFLPSGKNERLGPELLNLPTFSHLIQEVKKNYDFVFLLTKLGPLYAESEALLRYADKAILSTCEESLEKLNSFIQWAHQKENNPLAFILYQT